MKKRFLIVFSLLLITALLYSPLSGKGEFSAKRFGSYLKQAMSEWKVPGVAIGVIHKGKVILAQGYGFRDVRNKKPVTAGTIFAIGSSTKAMTSFAVGALVDEGKVEWDKPVKDYLADFKLFDPYVTTHITPRDLLNHNSGLPRHDLVWYGSKQSRKELYDVLRYLEPSAGFRSKFQYQNLMYMTAGYLIGQVTGSTWEEEVKKRILAPLGMTNSNYSVLESQESDDFALPYGGGFKQTERIHFYKQMEAIAPAGALNSNIHDMLRWVRLNLQKGKWQDKQLIKPNIMNQLHTPQVIAGGYITAMFSSFKELSYPTYGMGWFIFHFRGRKLLMHGGNINGFSAMVSFMPETQSGIVILTNKNGTFLPSFTAFHLYDRLLGYSPAPWKLRFKRILEKYMNSEQEKEKKEKAEVSEKIHLPTHPLEKFTGLYRHPAYGSVKIEMKDRALYFGYNNFPSPLKHSLYNVFELSEGMAKGMKVQFHIDEKGNIGSVSIPLEQTLDRIKFKRVKKKEKREGSKE
ncbi:MAG: serine hydrolase [bacterium]|nr:serine hydrolase [bacterium]